MISYFHPIWFHISIVRGPWSRGNWECTRCPSDSRASRCRRRGHRRLKDANIDRLMFEYCTKSSSMGSGWDVVRRAADFVTTDVVKDDLYNTFVHFGLIWQRQLILDLLQGTTVIIAVMPRFCAFNTLFTFIRRFIRTAPIQVYQVTSPSKIMQIEYTK